MLFNRLSGTKKISSLTVQWVLISMRGHFRFDCVISMFNSKWFPCFIVPSIQLTNIPHSSHGLWYYIHSTFLCMLVGMLHKHSMALKKRQSAIEWGTWLNDHRSLYVWLCLMFMYAFVVADTWMNQWLFVYCTTKQLENLVKCH